MSERTDKPSSKLQQTLAWATYRAIKALDKPMPDERVKGQRPKGVAILIALVTIAILSSVVVDLAYTTRVNLAMASNTRDKLKSYYMARSAVNISRLLIAFQFALQDESRNTDDEMGKLISRAMRRSNFQMYQYTNLLLQPFASGKLQSPLGGVDLQESGVEGFGDLTGELDAKVVPESGRVTLNDFYSAKFEERDLTPLCALMLDRRYDDIFELKDDAGETMGRPRILANLIDYIDPNREALTITNECTVQGSGGDEDRAYSRAGRRGQVPMPRNSRLTHIEELYMVHGVNDAFMKEFGEQFTVYDIGKPNINVASTPIFYSVLCRNVQLANSSSQDTRGFDLCARDPSIASQVLLLAMALDGVRQFFDDPLSVLLAYVGTRESQLLPSAKKGQPVAFLSLSQLPSYINDFQKNPVLLVQFMQYSITYQQLVALNPGAALDPIAPQLPPWTISFNRGGLVRDVSTSTPQIYRIKGIGRYGSTETVIESVVDFGKTIRRLPNEQELAEQETDSEDLKQLKELLNTTRQNMPKGRVLYWREY